MENDNSDQIKIPKVNDILTDITFDPADLVVTLPEVEVGQTLLVSNCNSEIEVAPQIGQLKYEDSQLLTYDGNEWHAIGLPGEADGYEEMEKFVDGLSVSQLQQIYKRKEELLIMLESKLLGKI